jgi:hypothetical protein
MYDVIGKSEGEEEAKSAEVLSQKRSTPRKRSVSNSTNKNATIEMSPKGKSISRRFSEDRLSKKLII